MKKVFNRDGEYVVRFAADAKEQIQKWLGENCPYDFAVKFIILLENSTINFF